MRISREWFVETVTQPGSLGLGLHMIRFEVGWCLLVQLGPWSVGLGRDAVAAVPIPDPSGVAP
jgi:hypothetical protein